MNTVYDLLLNFQEEPLAFYEWDHDDMIEHIKRIPMVRVKSEMLFALFSGDISLDLSFLQEIYQLTEKYNLERISYACLFTDGNMVLAVEFSEEGNSIFKSRLLLEDEEEIIKYALHEEEIEIPYTILGENKEVSFFTRKEKKVRHFLEREIIHAYEKKEYSKLRYLYLEYFHASENNHKKIKDSLLRSMEKNLDKKHFQLYELLMMLTKKNV